MYQSDDRQLATSASAALAQWYERSSETLTVASQPLASDRLPSTPWSRVLEKLIVDQLVKKFPAFHGTRRFITVFTRTRHRFLS
jgi:hypothetical protein